MQSQSSQKRRGFHEALRQRQIDMQFKVQRQRLTVPTPTNALVRLFEVLKNIKQLVSGLKSHDKSECLLQYLSIVEYYQVGKFLIQPVIFSHQSPKVRQGLLPIEVLWGQIFIILTAEEQNLTIQAQLLKILAINGRCMMNEQRISPYDVSKVVKQMVNCIPLQKWNSRILWKDLCRYYTTLFFCCKQIEYLYQIPHWQKKLIQLLREMVRDVSFLREEQACEAFIECGLVACFWCEQLSNDFQDIAQLKQELIFLILDNFKRSKVFFEKNCNYLKTFVLYNGVLPSNAFRQLQIFGQDAAQSLVPEYFEMMNTIMYKQNCSLSNTMVVLFLKTIFKKERQQQNNDRLSKTQKWIILMLHKHFALANSHKQQISTAFQDILNSNTEFLLAILSEMHQHSKLTFDILTNLIGNLLVSAEYPIKLLPEVLETLQSFQSVRSKLQEWQDKKEANIWKVEWSGN